MLDERIFRTDPDAAVGEIRIGPEGNECVRQKRFFVALRHRHDGGPARSHHRDCPGGELHLPAVPVAESMDDFEGIVPEGDDLNGLLNSGEGVGPLVKNDAVAALTDIDFGIFNAIGARFLLRRMPETVSAVVVPFFVAGPAGGFRVDVE